MDRRFLLLCFWFGFCASGVFRPVKIQAQQSLTPAPTAPERPQNRSFGRDSSVLAVSAEELSDGISIAHGVPQRFSAAVAARFDVQSQRTATARPTGAGFEEARQQDVPSPRLIAVALQSEVAADNSTVADDARPELSISGPLTEVSLSSAARLESVNGSPLVAPNDEAGESFAELGVQYEHSFARQFRPNRNRHPIWYKPLYFEDPNMERCGRGAGIVTEAVSAVRFFGRVPALPTMLANNPPCRCVRALPDCPSCHRFGHETYLEVPEIDGAVLQIAAVVGLIFLIP